MIKKFPLVLLLFLFFKTSSAYADVTLGSTVSATVASSVLGPAIHVSPTQNYASNNARITFVWQRPSPLPNTNLDHYVLYIDNAAFTSSVPDSLVYEDFYFYTSSAASGVFTIALKTDLSQGYHTWKVIVYDDAGQSTSSTEWTFYIDSVAPFISFTQLNSTTYTWTTADSATIPAESSRYLVSDTSTPTIKGKVETNANIQINVSCPSSPPFGCTNQTYVINSTDGNWEKQLTTLLADTDYIIVLTATDATSNSTIFPTFYIKYTVTTTSTPTPTPTATPTPTVTLTPTTNPTTTITPPISVTPTSSGSQTLPAPGLSITPTQSPIATISAQLTPPPELAAIVTPTPFTSKIAPAPTLPPQKSTRPRTAYAYGPYLMFLFLCLGLPLHLALTGFAIDTNFKNIFRYLFTLGFPFLKRKGSTTSPFTFVEIHDPNNLSAKPYRALSDIKGNIYYPKNLPQQVLVKVHNTNLLWTAQVINSAVLANACLFLLPKKIIGAKEKLQNNAYSIRLIPLVVAILTSTLGVIIFRSTYLIVYLYLSLQYTFSEYYYPKTKQD